MAKMSKLKKTFLILGLVAVAGTAVSATCYYKIPSYQNWIDKNVLKKEQLIDSSNQTGDNTSESDDELLLELESVKVALESANKTIADKDSELAIKAEALVEANNQLNAKQEIIDTLTSEKLTLEAEIAGLENELEACNGENAELQAELEVKQTELSNVNSQLETANLDKTELQAEVTRLGNQVTELMSQVSTLESEKETLQARVDELEVYLEKSESEIYIEDLEGELNIYKFSDGLYSLVCYKSSGYSFEAGTYLLKNSDYTVTYLNNFKYMGGFYELPNGNALIPSANTRGIYLYNNDDKTITLAYDCGYSYTYIINITDNLIGFSTNSPSSSDGLVVYNIETNEFSTPILGGGKYTNVITLGDKVFISGDYSSCGLILYDGINNTFERILTSDISAVSISFIYELDEYHNSLFTFSYNPTGLWYFDYVNNTFTQLYNVSNGWRNVMKLSSGDYLISTNNNGVDNEGLLYYDTDNQTVSKIYSSGFKWDSYEEDGDIVIITSSWPGISDTLYFNMKTAQISTNREDVEPDVIDGTYYFEMVSGSETMYKMSFTLTQSEIASHEEISDPYEAMSYEISKTDNVVTLNVRTLVTDESGSTLADETNHFTLTFNTETEEWTVVCEETLAEDITVNFYSEADMNNAGAGDDGYQEQPDMNEPEL